MHFEPEWLLYQPLGVKGLMLVFHVINVIYVPFSLFLFQWCIYGQCVFDEKAPKADGKKISNSNLRFRMINK